MKLIVNILLLFLFLGQFQMSSSQIINVEKERKVTDTIGFAGRLSLQGAYLDNDGEFMNFGVIPDVQYKTEKNLYLLFGSYALTKAEDIDFQNSGMIHFRFNRKINDLIRIEAFQQIQEDAVNRIEYRYLSGAGVRLKLLDHQNLKTYTGVLPMLELEQADGPSFVFQRDWRLSNYLSFSLFLNEGATLYSTTYYQPDINQIADFRVFNENQMSVELGKRSSFDLTTRYSWDSAPPTEAPNRFVSIAGGFSITTN